ncbi:hypothetical protein ASC95_05530 [Pelomonas sp. Root1217]|uniref:hypothetical protein n=1 Tax=Pelomonas sp. Root1217 TaxID=1736430 RepID=UPI00070D84AF|nr:hypothetical protein [Pelomonas sp. Root1217]KQV60884.1 hypothetical protein ASC95_05530 [Pelomonas sp. Root1217]
MAFVVGWVLVLLLLALWSSLVWAVQSFLTGLLAHAGNVGSGGWSLPESLRDWLPAAVADWLVSTVETLSPQLQSLASALPSLTGGVTLLAWVVWTLGAVMLFVFGLAIHVGVALWRKSKASTSPPATTIP